MEFSSDLIIEEQIFGASLLLKCGGGVLGLCFMLVDGVACSFLWAGELGM